MVVSVYSRIKKCSCAWSQSTKKTRELPAPGYYKNKNTRDSSCEIEEDLVETYLCKKLYIDTPIAGVVNGVYMYSRVSVLLPKK